MIKKNFSHNRNLHLPCDRGIENLYICVNIQISLFISKLYLESNQLQSKTRCKLQHNNNLLLNFKSCRSKCKL